MYIHIQFSQAHSRYKIFHSFIFNLCIYCIFKKTVFVVAKFIILDTQEHLKLRQGYPLLLEVMKLWTVKRIH